MTKSNQEKVWIGCEVQSEFHSSFKAMAKSNNRTLASEIRIALEAHYAKFKAKEKVRTQFISD